jgi:hypothetical protein
MIQDSFDPIFFTSTQKLRNKKTDQINTFTLKYKEIFEYTDEFEAVIEDFEKQSLEQRVTFYCVPIPGESEWVKKIYRSNNTSGSSVGASSNTSHRPSKRGIDSENDFTETPPALTERALLQDNSNLTKSSIAITSPAPPQLSNNKSNSATALVCNSCFKPVKETSTTNNNNTNNSISSESDTKKSKSNENKDETTATTKKNSIEFNLNFPLPTPSGVACLVKIYDNNNDNSSEQLKLNEMYEFVGILSQDPSLAYVHDDNASCSMEQVHKLQKLQEEQIAEFSKITLQNHDDENMEQSSANGENHTVCSCDPATWLGEKVAKKAILSSFPPSLVPRLHCLRAYRLSHDNPLLSNNKESCVNLDEEKAYEKDKAKYWQEQREIFLGGLCVSNKKATEVIDAEQAMSFQLASLRKEIVGFFQELLLGDSLAAEYLLMNLISNVFMRRDVTVLGKFCLNISNIPKMIDMPITNQENKNCVESLTSTGDAQGFAYYFYNALKQFLTMSHMFKMSTETLNKSNLIPNKDYNKDKLISGMLQLPDSFHLIIDETSLIAGPLNQKGLLNINSIKEIITGQKLSYDFAYHHQEFHTNIKVLILSETKSILPSDAHLKLKPSVETFDADKYINYISGLINHSDAQLIDNMRKYFTILSQLDYKLGEAMEKIVQDDIVKIRQTKPNEKNSEFKEKMNVDDLHLLLVVARLQSISYGKSELTVTEWNKAKLLENERLHKRV